jgi:S-adenosylmethionine hydrolase
VPKRHKIEVQVGDNKLILPYVTLYSDVPQGDALAFVSGTHQFLELAINFGNFSQTYKISVHQLLKIRKIP